MLMILGATFTGLAAWLILAESGVRPTDGRWGRGAHLVCGWLTLQGLLAPQGEFTFGVPQFSLLFSPILVLPGRRARPRRHPPRARARLDARARRRELRDPGHRVPRLRR